MPDPSICRQKNQLLKSLPSSAQARIYPRLTLVELNLNDVISEPGDVIEFCYFPVNCIISMLYLTQEGDSDQISMVGNEGVTGISMLMGSETTLSRQVVQSKGFAYRMSGPELKAEFNNNAEIKMLMLRYTQALITQMAQTVVCNRLHTIEQQLSRWLLLSLDRLGSNQMKTTQQLIANMLGVRRESVTEAAGKLQKQGIIDYRRGQITVLDRPGLKALSCECYGVVKKETDRLSSMSQQVAGNGNPSQIR